MKHLYASCIALLSVTLFSCQSIGNRQTQNEDSLKTLVGHDLDSLGCNKAAGLTWSQIRQTCIQPWEEGIKLHIVNSSASFQTAAYVLIDSTKNEAEVFMAEENGSIVLKKSGDEKYSNGNFNLAKEDFCWTLSLNDTKLYQELVM